MIKLGNIQIDGQCFKKHNNCEHKVFFDNKIELKNSVEIYNMIIDYIKKNKYTNIYESDILHFSENKDIKKEYIINTNGYIEYFPLFSNFKEQLYIKKLNENSILPTRIEGEYPWYNIYSFEDIEIPTRSYKYVKTGLSIKFPKKINVKIIPLFYNFLNLYTLDIFTQEKIKQNEYDEVKVLLYNQDKTNNLSIKKGDKIAKLILEKIVYPEFELIELDKNIFYNMNNYK